MTKAALKIALRFGVILLTTFASLIAEADTCQTLIQGTSIRPSFGAGIEVEVKLDNHTLERILYRQNPAWPKLSNREKRAQLTRTVYAKTRRLSLSSIELDGLQFDFDENQFIKKIENQSWSDRYGIRALELHFVTHDEQPGDFLLKVQAFIKKNNLKALGTHVHLPFDYQVFINKHGQHAPRIATELFRRANMVAETISLSHGHAVKAVSSKTENLYYFDSLKSEKLVNIFEYLTQTQKQTLTDGADEKFCFVGFRPAGKYCNRQLMGLEYRAISEHTNVGYVAGVLNQLGKKLATGDVSFDVPTTNFSWYNPEILSRDQINNWSPAVREKLHSDSQEKIISLIYERHQSNEAVLMLVYDWSQDPLLNGHLEKVKTIEAAQLTALDQLQHRATSEVVAEFLKTSGLLKLLRF